MSNTRNYILHKHIEFEHACTHIITMFHCHTMQIVIKLSLHGSEGLMVYLHVLQRLTRLDHRRDYVITRPRVINKSTTR